MRRTERELERQAEDQYRDRLITGSVYCGHCGYNLRTLPYVYACPECGREYNARPLVQRGVFKPDEVTFPVGELLTVLLCVPLAVAFLWSAIQQGSNLTWFIGVVFTALSVAYGFRLYYQLGVFLKARAILQRIRREEGEG